MRAKTSRTRGTKTTKKALNEYYSKRKHTILSQDRIQNKQNKCKFDHIESSTQLRLCDWTLVIGYTVKLRYNEIHGDREKFRCSENFVVAEKSVNKENRAGV